LVARADRIPSRLRVDRSDRLRPQATQNAGLKAQRYVRVSRCGDVAETRRSMLRPYGEGYDYFLGS
jgi:hypothetical protein